MTKQSLLKSVNVKERATTNRATHRPRPPNSALYWTNRVGMWNQAAGINELRRREGPDDAGRADSQGEAASDSLHLTHGQT